MPRRRARTTYWVIDLKQLSFWLAGAFVAGSLPNLADAVSTWLLLSLAILAALAGSAIWWLHVRKEGVGVYVHLPRPTDKPLSEKEARAKYKSISKNHRDWFRSGPDTPKKTVSERAEWTLSTISHRLDEAEYRDGEYPPIFLYIEARLEEAFALGRKYAEHQPTRDGVASAYEASLTQHVPLEGQVRSFSSFKEEDTTYKIDLSKISKISPHREKNGCSETLRVERRFNICDPQPHREPRLAVIIHAAGDSDSTTQNAFLQKAVAAAATGAATNGYSATEDDLCEHAVFFGINSSDFIERLKSGTADQIISDMFEHRRLVSNELYGNSDIPARVFMKAPSILAFAAGGQLPEGSKYVPYLQQNTVYESNEAAEGDLIAIIDGDDIGTMTEQHLLNGDLSQAVQYSAHIDTSMTRLIDTVQNIPNADVISQGGDSAIVVLAPSALDAFEEELDKWRSRKEIRVSCGVGNDCKEAFIALRSAKTSGKNTTVRT